MPKAASKCANCGSAVRGAGETIGRVAIMFILLVMVAGCVYLLSIVL